MSDDNVVTNTFQERLAAKRREREAAAQANQPTVIQTAPEPPVSVSEDDIPEVDTGLQLSQEEQTIDSAIAGIGIIEAYNRWANKGIVPPSTKTEGIKVSCPNPLHRDEHASAWINTDKNLWNCGGCAMGGDHWDIAAWHYGYEVPGYKDKELFRELRRKISTELGFKEIKGIAGTYLVRDVSDSSTQMISGERNRSNANPAESDTPQATGNVAALPEAIADEVATEEHDEVQNGPTLDWQEVLSHIGGDNTFLHEWMKATTVDTSPEEFHFWTGLMALGFAVGRKRMLKDLPDASPNLYVCLVGPSGAGKSRAKRHLTTVLREALPFDRSTPWPNGTRMISQPGSGEVLVDMFSHPIINPLTNAPTGHYASIRGYIDFDEMATLVTKINRNGSVLRGYLMETADAPSIISAASRTHGDIEAHNPFLQIMTTTQNDSLSALLSGGDDISGYINRWVFATGKMKPYQALPDFDVVLTESAKKLKSIWMWSIKSDVRMTFEPDARKAFSEWLEGEVMVNRKKLEKQKSAILSRTDVLMKKLLVILAANEELDTIPLHVVDMVKLIYPYIVRSYGVVYQALGNTEAAEVQDKIKEAILRWCRKNGTPPSFNSIRRSLQPRHRDLKLLRDNIKLMVEVGIINEIAPDGGTRGRPAVRYEVVAI